jgi:type IV secretory pathway VirB4 component
MAILAKKGKQQHTPQTTALLDILSPTAMQFYPRHFIFGEKYYSVVAIIDFPPRIEEPAWLSRIATHQGVILSIHVRPTDPFKLIENIKKETGEIQGKIDNGGNPATQEAYKEKLETAKQLLKKINNEQQRVVYLTALILVWANDLDELNQRKRRVESILAGAGMRARTPMLSQEEALKSVAPFKILEPKISALADRNMPVESVAGAYPFVYSGINDGDGILLGSDKSGGIVLVNPWIRSGNRTNSNMTIMGRPGVGKSTAVKKFLLSEYARGTKIIIIDPEREYRDLCLNLGGDWIDCGGGEKGRINPLQVRYVPTDDDDEEEKLYPEQLSSRGPLSLHFQTLRTFFSLELKGISTIQQGLLEIALEEVYKRKGITWGTDPRTVVNGDWPILPDLYHLIEEKSKEAGEDPNLKELAILLRSSAIGSKQSLWSGPTTIQANSDFVVLDIHNLLEADENTRRAQMFNVLSWAWNKIAEDRTQRVLLAVDEAYLLVDPETPQALQFLRNTSKRIRKYEGGLLVITHNMVDFLDPAVRRYGQALIDNPVYKLIMGQGEKDIEALTKLMNLSDREVQTLLEGKRGEGLFIAGNRRIHVKIDVSPFELEMFGAGGGR